MYRSFIEYWLHRFLKWSKCGTNFTRKYIEINERGFLILSNFIGIKKSISIFQTWPGRGTRLGTQLGPSLYAKIHEYGKKFCRIWWLIFGKFSERYEQLWLEKYYVIEYQWFYHCACLCKATLVIGKPVGHFCSG